jgi:hypothetical protein
MSNDTTGRLEGWYREQVSNKEFVINANIFDDVHGRWKDGHPIHTSAIKNRQLKEGDIVTTRNSTYLLGKKLVVGE